MAKVQYGVMVGSIRGSVGGVTYSNEMVSLKRNPVRRVRSTQPQNRARIGYLSRLFGTIGNTYKALWEAWAQTHPKMNVFGSPFIMSAINAFTSLNQVVLACGGIPQLAPPTADLLMGLDSLVSSDGIASGAVILTWTVNGVGDADDFVQSQYEGPNASQLRAIEHRWRPFELVAGNLFTDTITALQPEAWYHFRSRYVGVDGQVSAWLYTSWQAPTV